MKRIFNPIEWKGFYRACLRSPWRIPILTFELIILVCRRIRNQFILRTTKDRHYGLKKFPGWLPKIQSITLEEIQNLIFPKLFISPCSVEYGINTRLLDESDKEADFQKNRWASCLEMMVSGMIDGEEISSIRAWIQTPPPKSDGAWETYSCCERVVNLSLLLSAYPDVKNQFNKKELIAFFVESGNWIANHLEYYGLEQTNNHFLNNGRALIVSGAVLDHQPWIDAGLSIFRKFAPLLFGVDGFLREGSSHYQLVVAGWFFDGLRFAQTKVNFLESDPLIQLGYLVGFACQQFSVFLPDMTTLIGDISPDAHPKLSLARLIAIHSFWFSRNLSKLEQLPSLNSEWLFANTATGAVVVRWPKQWPSDWTTHAHADLGSFVWSYQKYWILVDPGRIDYTVKGNRQLSAGAHNTILINGASPLAESVLNAGIWYPKFYTQAQINSEADGKGGVALTHNGFSRVITHLIHTRKLNLTDDGLNVIDSLQGSGTVQVELIWNFPPEFRPLNKNIMANSELQVYLFCQDSRQSIHHAQTEQYTYSKSYGEGVSAYKMIVSCEVDLPCLIETQFLVKNLLCAE